MNSLINIKKLYAKNNNVSLSSYNIYFSNTLFELYNLIIFPIIKSFTIVTPIPNVVCSINEHPYIINILDNYIKQNIVTVTYINPDIYGEITAENLENQLENAHTNNNGKKTCLIIISAINSEIGTINNLKQLSSISHKYNIPLFSDCINIYGKVQIEPTTNNIDIFTSQISDNLFTLGINKELFNGYNLNLQSLSFQNNDKIVNLNVGMYNSIIKNLTTNKTKKQMNINEKNTIVLKKYTYTLLEEHCNKTKNKLYYYDSLITQNIMPKMGDIVILGHNINDISKSFPNIITFIYISKKTQKPHGMSNSTIKTFEVIGIRKKWIDKIVFLDLTNKKTSDINKFLKSL
jgi:hypothetical protein